MSVFLPNYQLITFCRLEFAAPGAPTSLIKTEKSEFKDRNMSNNSSQTCQGRGDRRLQKLLPSLSWNQNVETTLRRQPSLKMSPLAVFPSV